MMQQKMKRLRQNCLKWLHSNTHSTCLVHHKTQSNFHCRPISIRFPNDNVDTDDLVHLPYCMLTDLLLALLH